MSMNVEHRTFTPLVFSINGGEDSQCLDFNKHIADKIALKTDDRFEHVMTCSYKSVFSGTASMAYVLKREP